MKKGILLGVVLLLIFSSCTKQKERSIKIALLMHSTQTDRWQKDIKYILAEAKAVGAEVILKDANDDENLQLKQASEVLEEGVDAILIVAVNQNTAGGVVREAHSYNVPVIGYDRIIKNCDLDYLMSFEYNKVGTTMAQYVLDRVPKGNYVVICGDPNDENARFVKRGIEAKLEKHIKSGDINITYKTFIDDWSKMNAKHKMNKVLDFTIDKIDAAIVCNDNMAMGVMEAFDEHGYDLNDLVITGQDATLNFVQSLIDGEMTMSQYKPIEQLAKNAIDLTVDLVQNKKMSGITTTVNNGRKEVPAQLLDPIIVDIDNYETELIDRGVYTIEQIYMF